MNQHFIINGARHQPHTHKNASELQAIAEEHYEDIFGDNLILFNFEPKLGSLVGWVKLSVPNQN